MNREIRRKIPKGFDLSKVSDKDVSDLEMALNNLPRRVLKYSTPQELFEMQMSHLTKS
jgi:IS30 family transposase